MGIPEDEAGYYAEGVRRGGTLLTVRANENQVSRATEILNRFSPVNVNERATEWRSSGWSGFDPNAETYRSDMGTHTGTAGMGTTGMGTTGMGTGSSSTYSGAGYTNRFEDFDNDFRSDWQTRYRNTGYGYERYQPAYRYGFESRNRFQGRNWNDVERDLRSDWERSYPNDRWEDFKDSVRMGWERFKEGVRDTAQDVRHEARDMGRDVERGFDRTTSDMSRGFDQYDRDFRNDWEQSFRSTGYGYERYRPAYQYGHTLATEKRYRGRTWTELETDARRDWETRHPGDAWEDFKDAVRHAWQRVRADVRDAID